MIEPVGTFGGYEGRAIRWTPDKHGLLTFAVRGSPLALTAYWSFGKSGETVLGELSTDRGGQSDLSRSDIHGWVTLERELSGARLLLSRAWPALRLHHPRGTVRWQSPATRLLAASRGQPRVSSPARTALDLSEPWLVLFRHGGAEDAAILVSLTASPARVVFGDGGLELEFRESGAVHVMPLEGIRRHSPGSEALDHWTASARSWVPALLSFPMGCEERPRVAGGRMHIATRFSFEELGDAWGNRADPVAPFPPSLALAAAGGYPVEVPRDLVSRDAQRCIATFYGPFSFVPGREHAFSLPLPVCLEPPAAPSRSRATWAEPIREELGRIFDDVGEPTDSYVDNNLRAVTFLADALPELDEAQRERARSYAERALTISLRPLFRANEPLTQQAWWTLGKTWRAHFSPADPPWAKDHERFDSEFYNGQASSAIEAASRIDPALGDAFLDEARRLDVYGRIFRDWPTGTILTHATGDSANIDGIQFAWEGTIATARLARAAGDEAWFLDATHRAARQQAALFAMWCHGDWVREQDYAIGHVCQTRLRPDEVEVTGPIDAFVEEYGAATLELRSYWQTTNFLFYANRPLFELYRQYGLLERIRTLEYELMPRHHPRWFDGHAVNADGENGQERYGAAWTAAHLAARALLFEDDPVELFQLYQRTKDSPAAQTWYRMQLPQIAGPLMLALLEASGPTIA